MGPWSATEGVKGSHHGPSSSLRLRLGAQVSQRSAGSTLSASYLVQRRKPSSVIHLPNVTQAVVGMQSARLATSARLSFRNVDPCCLRLDTAINERPRLCLRRPQVGRANCSEPLPKYTCRDHRLLLEEILSVHGGSTWSQPGGASALSYRF